MSEFKVPAVTRRMLRPYGVAFVTPDFPEAEFWSTFGEYPRVWRGEDVHFDGELVVYDAKPLFTGQVLKGTYEVYWSAAEGGSGVSLLEAGATPIGSLATGWLSTASKTYSVTTPQGVDSDEARHLLPLERTIVERNGATVITSPTGCGNNGVGIDVLIDANHNVCGYVFNGDDEGTAFEARLLPDESDRVSVEQFLEAARALPADGAIEIVSSDGQSLGLMSTVEPESQSWVIELVKDGVRPDTVAEWLEYHAPPSTTAHEASDKSWPTLSDIGVTVMLPDNYPGPWVERLEPNGTTLRLHLREDRPLLDSPLTPAE